MNLLNSINRGIKQWIYEISSGTGISVLTTKEVKQSALQLKNVWSTHWQSIDNEGQSVQAIVLSIDSARTEIKILLKGLK